MGKIVAMLIIVTLTALSGCQRELILTASDTVNVYSTLDAATDIAGIEFFTLQSGDKATILKCIDLKHYYVYQVMLSNGQEGFVNVGEYSITHHGVTAHCR